MTASRTDGTALSRTERLDRLRVGPEHRRVLVGSGVGWALDAMDVGLVSFVMLVVARQWQLADLTTSLVAAIGFAGMAVGAGAGGFLADRFGRRQVFALTLVVYGLATGASALAGSVGVLIALRFVVGLGLGAELPVASTLVSEFSPPSVRGRMVVALESFWAVGWVLAALLGYLVVPVGESGWRWALAAGAVPAVYALIVRYRLPESVRFLEARGRGDEAERVVRRFEASQVGVMDSATSEVGVPVVDARSTSHSGAGPRGVEAGGTAAVGIFSRELRGRTAALWAVWFLVNLSYYGAFVWLPTLIAAHGFSLVKSFEYTLLITVAQVPGYACAAWLVEVWGRRATLASFLAGSALSAAAFGVSDSAVTIIAAGMCLSFFNLGAWGALYAVSPEVYPTRVRATGTGAAAAFGRVASIIAPFMVPLLVSHGGQVLVFAVFGAVFALAAVCALALPERRRLSLDEPVESVAAVS